MDFGSVIADAGELYLQLRLDVLQEDHAGVPLTNSHHFKASHAVKFTEQMIICSRRR